MSNENSTTELSARDREINRKIIEKTRRGFFGFFIKRWRLTILLAIGIAVWGFLSFLELPLEASPEVQIPVALVTTVYPGASPSDVEELITKRVEEKLDDLENMDIMTSNSSFGASMVAVQFEAGADVKESIRALRDRISTVTGLPKEAEDPQVMEIRVNDLAIITFSLVGDLTDEQLKELGERVQSELEAIKGVSKVDLIGARAREFSVILDKGRMQSLGIDINQVVSAIAASNISFPLGSVEVDRTRYNLRTVGQFEQVSDLEGVVVKNVPSTSSASSDRGSSGPSLRFGALVQLRDVAEVRDQLKEKTTISRISLEKNPLQNVISLQVYKRTGGNIVEIADRAEEELGVLQKQGVIPKEVKIEIVSDLSEYIRQDVSTLGKSGLQTFIFVFVLLACALAIRQAAVAALAVPLIFLGTFGVIKLQGQTLNSLTLFSLVISIGLLVDTLIIILEGLHDNLMKGYKPQEAALLSVGMFKGPLTAGVMTTIAAFAPMFLVSGIMGEFLEVMPLTISATLGFSLFVALIIIPSLAARVIKKIVPSNYLKSGSNISNNFDEAREGLEIDDVDETDSKMRVEKECLMERYFTKPLQKKYRVFIRNLLRIKKRRQGLVIGAIIAFVVSLGVLVLGIVPTQLYPNYDIPYFVINLELPNGSVLEETEAKVGLVEEILLETPEVETFVTNIGSGSSLAFTGFGVGGGTAENAAAFTVNLFEIGERPMYIEIRNEKLEIRDDGSGLDALVKKGREGLRRWIGQEGGEDLNDGKEVNNVNTIVNKVNTVVNNDDSGEVDDIEIRNEKLEIRDTDGEKVNKVNTVVNKIVNKVNNDDDGDGEDGFLAGLMERRKGRVRKSYEVAQELRSKFKKIDGAKITIAEVEEGPPSGEPVEVRISGDDLGVLDTIANDIKIELEKIPGAVEVSTGASISPPEFAFKLKQEELGRYNLSAAQVSGVLRSAIYGAKASEVTLAGEDIEVVVRYPEESVDTIEELKNLEIINLVGEKVRLSQVADFELAPALENINHRNQKRIISVTAKNQGVPPAQIFTQLQDKLKDYKLPAGYEIIYGGEFEQIQESFTELGYAMIVAVILILFILILEFDSFKQPIIIILTLPMALIGVVFGLFILGMDFGFPVFLGLVGLAGIVVNDAIVLIDRINHNLKERGLELVEAIAEAGEARLQPIFLTTITTMAGVLPLTFAGYGVEFWRGLAVTIIFGIAFSTILTLSLVPVLYRWLERKRGRNL